MGLVRGGAALVSIRRRALDAAVLTCVSLLVVLAIRNSLWRIVRGIPAAAGIPRVYALMGLTGPAVFAVVFAIESLRHSDATPAR